MRVLLYDNQLERYFRSPDDWTNDPRGAFDFHRAADAATTAFQHGLREVEIILDFEDVHLRNMHLPLTVAPWTMASAPPA